MSRLRPLALATLILGLTLPAARVGIADAQAADPAVVTLDPTVDRTGTEDVTLAIRQAMSTVPAGGTFRLQRNATYRVEGSLRMKDRRGVTFDGNGATIFATLPNSVRDSHLWIDRGEGITIRNLTIRGANPDAGVGESAYKEDHETVHGIRAEGTIGLEIDRVTVTDVFGDFVYIGRDPDRVWSEDVWIHDSTFRRNGRQGLAFTAVRRVVVERNLIADTRRATIDLEPNTKSWGVEDAHIIDNRIGPGRLRFIASHGGGPVTNTVVARNRLSGHALTVDLKPPDVARRQGIWVVDNTSDEVASPGPIKIIRYDGVVVTGNDVPTRRGAAAVDLRGVCSVLVRNNTVLPASIEFTQKGPACGEVPDGALPPPPKIPAREAALANPTTSTQRPSTTVPTTVPTTTPGGVTTTVPAGSTTASDDGTSPWLIGLAVLALVALVIGAALWLRRQGEDGDPGDGVDDQLPPPPPRTWMQPDS